MHIVEVFGRILLSALFLIEGVKKIFFSEETIMYMEDYGVPEILFIPAIIIEILFPLLLIIGYKTRFSASIMALFTLTVAIIFHTNFNDQMQLIIFLKDIAIAGGFLIIAANEPKICSIDYTLKSKAK
jgi:putative oxidoreductase